MCVYVVLQGSEASQTPDGPPLLHFQVPSQLEASLCVIRGSISREPIGLLPQRPMGSRDIEASLCVIRGLLIEKTLKHM